MLLSWNSKSVMRERKKVWNQPCPLFLARSIDVIFGSIGAHSYKYLKKDIII